MFGYDFYSQTHGYSFAASGLGKKVDRSFSSRNAANEYMYKLCKKYGLSIIETWDDHHDKTYVCTNGVKFYIQREY